MLYTAEIVQSFIDNDQNLVDHFNELQNKEGNEKYWAEQSFKGFVESIIQESISEEIGEDFFSITLLIPKSCFLL